MIKKIKNPALKKSKFIIVPEIKEDELLTSWFVRMAYAHHTHPHTFMNLHLDKNAQTLSYNDFDICITDKELKLLEEKSKKKVSLYNTTLKSYSGYLQEKIINDGLNKMLCIQRYCPLCLREDVIYFRKKWRIIFNTVCEKHKCFLYDRCPNCNSYLDITRMFQNKLSFKYCFNCGFLLSKARKIPILEQFKVGYKAVINLNRILKKGYIVFRKEFVYSFFFFDSMLQLSKKILKHKKNLYINRKKIYKYIRLKNYKSTIPVIHQLSIKEQCLFFSLLCDLFTNYPKNIKKYIKENNLSYRQIVRDMDYICFWFENLINRIVPRKVYISKILTKNEIKNGKIYLKSKGLLINKATLSRLFGCNFFSRYNKLDIGDDFVK